MPVPATIAELTPAWLTAALAEGGGPGSRVATVDTEPIGLDTGFLGHLARLHLAYDGGDGPATLVAKLPTTDPGGRAVGLMLGVWARESRFYTDLASRCAARVPACYYNGADPAAGRWALLLEDIADGQHADQVAGASDDEARACVDALAALHRSWWGQPRPTDWLPGFDRPAFEGLQAAMAEAVPRFVTRFGDLVPSRTLDWLGRFVAVLPEWADSQGGGPLTLAHLDYRLDNLLLDDERGVAILDWQTAVWGPGVLDLASFCATSLTPGARRRLEGELITRYADGVAHDVDGVALARDYRSALLWWMAIFANNLSRIEPGAGRAEALFTHMVERAFTAADDHDAGDLLAPLR